MLIPLVALVPTSCRETCQEGVAPEYLYGLGSAVQNNVAAHYVSAVGFFVMIVAVCVVGWRLARTRPQVNVPGRPVHYSRIYGLTGLGMVVVIVVGVVLGLGRHFGGWGTPFTLIFWVEALLLGLFGVFWVAQTVENWQVEAREPATPSGP